MWLDYHTVMEEGVLPFFPCLPSLLLTGFSLIIPYYSVPSLVALTTSGNQKLSHSPSGPQGKVENVRHLASCTKKPLDSLPLHCEKVTPGLARLYPVSQSNGSS